jgi:hypothetical protein
MNSSRAATDPKLAFVELLMAMLPLASAREIKFPVGKPRLGENGLVLRRFKDFGTTPNVRVPDINVRSWGKPGRHLPVLSISQFDPNRSFGSGTKSVIKGYLKPG